MTFEIDNREGRLQITHTFPASRSTVFEWWSKPEKLRQWLGCAAAADCEVTMNFRVDGFFTQTMQIADKGQFTLHGTYDEIVEPERISYHANLGRFTVRVLLEFFDQDGMTRVVMTQEGFPDEMDCKTVSQGTLESLETLDALLSGVASATLAR